MASRLTLIGGGARSGKSSFAQGLAMQRGQRRVYLATAEAHDQEMGERIARHVEDRGQDFRTVEAAVELERALRAVDQGELVVIDCLTLWLSNLCCAELDPEVIELRIEELVETLAWREGETIVVTNEVGLGIVPTHALGRLFRDLAGRAHQRLAAVADEVYLGAMGAMLRLKPAPVVAVFGGESES